MPRWPSSCSASSSRGRLASSSRAIPPVLVQSRPITVEGAPTPDARVRRLTRANVGEVLPDPVTPLTATTLLVFLEEAFRRVARRAGLLPRDAPPFLVLHRERLYLNLT